MTQNTVPLPEPATVTVLNEVAYYTTDQMHAHAAKVCAEKDAEITKWIRRSDKTWHEKHFTDQIAERDAEIDRHVQEVDASRNRIDALTQVVAELVEGLTAIVDSPASRPQSKTVAMLAIARAALKETK